MPDVKASWTGLYILSFAVFGVITTEVVPIGLLPDIVADFSISKATAGLLVSIYALLVALAAVPLTRYTRRIARKPLLLMTLALFTMSNIGAALAPDFGLLLLTRAVGGIAHALFFAIVIGYAARLAPPGQTGRAIALISTGTSAGLVMGVPAGTTLGELLDWRAVFATLGVLVGLTALLALKMLAPIDHDAEAGKTIIPGGSRMLLVATLAGCCFFGYYMLYTYVSPLLLDAGLDKVWLSAMLVAMGLAGLIGIRIAARSLDSHPLLWMILVPAAILVAQVGFAMAFPSLWPVLLLAVVWAAAFGPVNSTYQNLLVRVGKDGPEMAGAWINSFCNIGIGAGGALGGLLVSGPGYSVAGFAGAAIISVVLALTLVLRKHLAITR